MEKTIDIAEFEAILICGYRSFPRIYEIPGRYKTLKISRRTFVFLCFPLFLERLKFNKV